MNDTDALLVRILARTDATFLPIRDHKRPRPGNTALARIDYRHSRGIAWVAGGSAVDRSKSSRTLADAVAAGLVTVSGSRVRVSHVALTENAERRARALVGLPTLADAIVCARHIAEHVSTGKWLIEPVLAGTNWGTADADERFMDIEDKLLPALIRGWVESGSDCYGRAAYRLTSDGAVSLEKNQSDSLVAGKTSEGASEEYHATIAITLAALGTNERNSSEIGQHSLSCSDMYYEPKEHGRKKAIVL
jgi:hypothetical protein